MSAKTFCMALCTLIALAGCGPSVEDVCEDLDDECLDALPEEDCVQDGERLQAEAEDSGCEDAFNAYLDCIDAAVCDWRSACGDPQLDLEICVGGLPD